MVQRVFGVRHKGDDVGVVHVAAGAHRKDRVGLRPMLAAVRGAPNAAVNAAGPADLNAALTHERDGHGGDDEF